MLDFIKVSERSRKKGITEIYPRFVIPYTKDSDLMIRGGAFYAIWNAEKGLWCKDEQEALYLIDKELDAYAEKNKSRYAPDERILVLHMWDTENKVIDSWKKYCQRQTCDNNFHPLDETLIFSNHETSRKDYASKRLSYPLEACPIPAYEKLISTLYSEEERRKIEWAIGSIVSGDSKNIQKFLVLYGAAGTGKSTILNIIQQLFDGYYSVFDAKALGSATNAFALEAFKNNPLVAIQHDGDLSHIEDNTRLNSLVSHELMTVNEKFKSTYENRFNAFLFMGTNRPVKITDAKSGLIRRLIDVTPTGNKLPKREYDKLVKQVAFELGGIAKHCLDIYMQDPGYYDNYIPLSMMGASNDFYNYVLDSYFIFKENDGTTLAAAWKLYTAYCEDAKVGYPMSRRIFREELKNYFDEYRERYTVEDGTRVRSYYSGFKSKIFDEDNDTAEQARPPDTNLIFEEQASVFDEIAKDYPAQYASSEGTPMQKWDTVTTKLSDLDTSKLHYVKLPENHIVIDFDLKDETGQKSFAKNLEAASAWPTTYAELSKSGQGIHLHYIYNGDASKLSSLYDKDIEIKVPKGNSSLRRMLTKCTASPIATISSGLPLKGDKKVLGSKIVRSQAQLRRQIEQCLAGEVHPNTAPSVSMIQHLLQEAYDSGMQYDVSDMRNAILGFAASSTNQSANCIKMVTKMKFKSDDPAPQEPDEDEKPLIFFDCEVFPNLFIICWMRDDEEEVHTMINPSPERVWAFMDFGRLVGFNCRKYDNHIVMARAMGTSIPGLFDLSNQIINHKKGFIRDAYNLSYTDIYDFSSVKQSLKKFEIDLKIHHKELGMRWDQPVPEDRWEEVAEYCKNDVIATKATFHARKADFAGRKILAKLAKGTVNDTTNSLTERWIFNGDKNPQSQFNYRFMGEMPDKVYRSKADAETGVIFNNFGDEYTLFDAQGRPIFKDYTFDTTTKTSIYRGEEVGEGGYVYAEPGMYGNVALLDIESMHPHSLIAEKLFGEYYTERFAQIVQARLAIKHKDFDTARSLLNGELAPYLDDPELVSGLKQALKIAINSVYGLTSAKFENACRDPRNVDNIVAKRGALFMINLKHEVQKRGFRVAHIKTDSIKIPDATPEIIKFVQDYGEQYGYKFLHEATYERMCLVNNAVYIAKYDTPDACMAKYGYVPVDIEEHPGEWTATGTQFAVPYVFKSLFSKEDILFDDLCETKSVTSSIYLDFNESLPVGTHDYRFVGRVGRFCPIKPGANGGELLREMTNKRTGELSYAAVTGTKGYRWLESEDVWEQQRENDIDRSYYDKLVDDAVDEISKYGDIEWFVSDDPYVSNTEWPYVDLPPWD